MIIQSQEDGFEIATLEALTLMRNRPYKSYRKILMLPCEFLCDQEYKITEEKRHSKYPFYNGFEPIARAWKDNSDTHKERVEALAQEFLKHNDRNNPGGLLIKGDSWVSIDSARKHATAFLNDKAAANMLFL